MNKIFIAAAMLSFGLGVNAQSQNGTYYEDNGSWYYMIEDFEGKAEGATIDYVNQGGTGTVATDHTMQGEKALKVAVGNYKSTGALQLDVTLPDGITLNEGTFTNIQFDVYFAEGDVNYKSEGQYDQGFRVWLSAPANDNMIWTYNTGDVINKTIPMTVALAGHYTGNNTFSLYIGGLSSNGTSVYYIDNIRMLCVGDPTTGPVAAEGIALDQTSAEVVEGRNITLVPTFTPANATNKTVTWTSSDDAVATVVNGVVTGVTPGNATITVTTEDGGFTATCNVTVTAFTSNSKNGQVVMGGMYLMLEDFEDGIIGTDVYEVENANGATAQVAADPNGASDNALCYHNPGYNNTRYMKFDFTLPEGKKLSDYKAVAFDIFNGSGYGDNTYKDAMIYVDEKDDAHQLFSGRLLSGNSANWTAMEYSLEGKASDSNTFTLYIGGINAGDMRIFIDNIRLKQDSEYAQVGSSKTYWKYDEGTTTLTIVGEGAMPDFGGFWDTPYKPESGACQMTELVIGEGITAIGNFAFHDCQHLTSVTFPSTLKTIGNGAFKTCVALTDLNIPATVESIGNDAFLMPAWLGQDRTYTLNSIPTFGTNSFKFENTDHKAIINLVLDDAVKPFIATTDANMPEIAQAEYKRNVTAAYSTICLPFNAAIPGGVTVYEMSDASAESITLTEAANIEAGKPYVVATANLDITEATPTISVATTPAGASTMQFVGVMQQTVLNAGDNAYGLSDGTLYLNKGTMTVSPMRAYFHTTSPAPAREMSFNLGGEATAISNVSAMQSDIVAVYGANGARQARLSKGVNLVKTANGNIVKVIVK